jgi:hypothetical protein
MSQSPPMSHGLFPNSETAEKGREQFFRWVNALKIHIERDKGLLHNIIHIILTAYHTRYKSPNTGFKMRL